MINNFRVTYMDVNRQARIASVGVKSSDVVRHALQAKHGNSFTFEKYDNGTSRWVPDTESEKAFRERKLSSVKNAPDTALSASLSSLASAASAMGKIASRKPLSDAELGELYSLMNECVNTPSMKAFSQRAAENAAQDTPTKNAAPSKR